ncbi:MAG TPA: ABC transporter permease [Gemmata sp.]|nr:ABC transporter permease [Gemmata sp.]
MSMTTPEKSPSDHTPITAPVPLSARAETAPSALVAEGAATVRMIGTIGLFLVFLGAVVVIATRWYGKERMIPEGWALMGGALGFALMLYHAMSDGELEIRRTFGGFALFWILFGIVASLLPGPFVSGATDRTVGYYLLPWGVGSALIGLLFSIPFTRHETDEFYRNATLNTLLAIGALLSVGSVAAGLMRPEFLTGPGLCLALLGLAYVCAYLGQVDTSDGVGYTVAFTLGAFGAGVVLFSIGRAAFPTLLHEGPRNLRLPNGSLDTWKLGFRILGGIAFLVPAVLAFACGSPRWLKSVTTSVGLVGAGVVVTSLFSNPMTTTPRPFLVPNGLILMTIGLIYLAISLGTCSDNQFVTLTRRELAAYFTSPIGYLVLAGMAFVQWLVYESFIGLLQEAGQQKQPLNEPIVAGYLDLLPAIVMLLQIPALTMRLVAEEKRSGTLEVLLTAPVNEWPVILSKFFSTWCFFLITWLPAGLYLVALRMEVPLPFDYRPILSFYVCIAAQGLAFVGLGLFFSTVTKNQVVAAVLAFVGMFFFLLCFLVRVDQVTLGLPPAIRAAIGRLSFFHMWRESLAGRLPLRDCFLFGSLGVLGLFLSVKVMEMRKWS